MIFPAPIFSVSVIVMSSTKYKMLSKRSATTGSAASKAIAPESAPASGEMAELMKLIKGLSSKMESGLDAVSKRLDEVEARSAAVASSAAASGGGAKVASKPVQTHVLLPGWLARLPADDERREYTGPNGDGFTFSNEGDKKLSAGALKVYEEIGHRDFETLGDVADFINGLKSQVFTKGSIACSILTKEYADELMKDVDRTPKKSKGASSSSMSSRVAAATKAAAGTATVSPAKTSAYTLLTRFTSDVNKKNKKGGDLVDMVKAFKDICMAPGEEADAVRAQLAEDFGLTSFPKGSAGASDSLWVATTLNKLVAEVDKIAKPNDDAKQLLEAYEEFITLATAHVSDANWANEGGECGEAFKKVLFFLEPKEDEA
jgi:hypothetical protein